MCGPGVCNELCPCDEGGSCTTSTDCLEGLTCGPYGTCWDPRCGIDPRALGCGFPDAPCGETCSTKSPCQSDADCPAGEICGENNGDQFASEFPRVCMPAGCLTAPHETGCGSTTSPCGLCTCVQQCEGKVCGGDLSDNCNSRCTGVCGPDDVGCQQDSDCESGFICVVGGGPRKGHPAGTNVCMPAGIGCESGSVAPPLCGSVDAPCGECVSCTPQCADRECGPDPRCGASCGSCAGGEVCNGAGQCVEPFESPPVEVPDGSGGTREVTPLPSPEPNTVGAIPGEFSVSDRASATYVVPLRVPPGRAEMQPDLTLRYTSSTGVGALGVGWSLDGLSVVSRCQRTAAQDGYTAPVLFNDQDAYCLDGARLVVVNGLPYGSNGAEYRTEIDTFARIKSVGGSALTGPAEFVVETKDGRTLRYGTRQSTNAYWDEERGIKRTWALASVTDRAQNTMLFDYTSRRRYVSQGGGRWATSELLPWAITYTGHIGTQTAGDRTLRFHYGSDRPDTTVGYGQGGAIFERTSRLERVEASISGVLVRRYRLEYDVAPNGLSRLSRLFECAGPEGSACLRPTEFSYYEEEGGLEQGSALGSFNPMGIPLYHRLDRSSQALSVLYGNTFLSLDTLLSPEVEFAATTTLSFFPPYGPLAASAVHFANALTARTQIDLRSGRRLVEMTRQGATITEQPRPCEGAALPQQNVVRDIHGSEQVKDSCYVTAGSAWDPRACTASVWAAGLCRRGDEPLFCAHPSVTTFPSCQTLFETLPACSLADFLDGRCLGPVTPAVAHPREWYLDLNGDGTDDRAFCEGTELKYELNRWENTGIPAPSAPGGQIEAWGDLCKYTCADLTQVGIAGPSGGRDAFTCMIAPAHVIILDIDGDGSANLLAWDRQGWAALVVDAAGPRWVENVLPAFIHPNLVSYYMPDINGDGLRDIVAYPIRGVPATTPIFAWRNTGSGFVPSLTTERDPIFKTAELPAYVVDFDRDGTDELVRQVTDGVLPGHPAFWLAQHFSDNGDVPNFALTHGEPQLDIPNDPGFFGDFDGDSNPDLLTVNDGGNVVPYWGKGRRANLLKAVVDGLGREITVQYDATNALGEQTYTIIGGNDCRWPRACLRKLDYPAVSDHVDSHYLDQARTAVKVDRRFSYTYAGATADHGGRGWLGFQKRTITALDAAGELMSRTTLEYHDNAQVHTGILGPNSYYYPFAGTIERITEELPEVDSPIAINRVARTTVTSQTWETKQSTLGRPFTALKSRTTDTHDVISGQTFGFLLSSENETFDVDGFGNVTRRVLTTETKAGPLFGSETTTELRTLDVQTLFSPTAAEIAGWRIDLPKNITVIHRVSGPLPEASHFESTSYFYDDQGLLELVMQRPHDSQMRLETTLTRDDFGNVVQAHTVAVDGSVRDTFTTFDARGLFAETFTNAKGHVSQVRYDDRFGTVTLAADPNGIDQRWAYDDFGRLRRYDGLGQFREVDYDFADRSTASNGLDLPAAVRVTSNVAGGAHVEDEIDALGQLVRRRTRGLLGAWVNEEYAYDVRNRLEIASRPHLDGDASQGVVTFEYDPMNRLVRELYPDGANVQYAHASARNTSELAARALAPRGRRSRRGDLRLQRLRRAHLRHSSSRQRNARVLL